MKCDVAGPEQPGGLEPFPHFFMDNTEINDEFSNSSHCLHLCKQITDSSVAAQQAPQPRSAGQLSFLQGCRCVDQCFVNFLQSDIVGQGTYGVVRKVQPAPGYRPSLLSPADSTANLYALKLHRSPEAIVQNKQRLHPRDIEAITARTLRELQFLQRWDSQYVVRLVDILRDSPEQNAQLCSVFEWCPSDLHKLIHMGAFTQRFQREHQSQMTPMALIRATMRQVLLGLRDLHGARIAHRDLKPANVLVSSAGDCRIGDLGMARVLDLIDCTEAACDALSNPLLQGPYEPRVCTALYRAPELCLLSRIYDLSSDIWSAGILFSELLAGQPLTSGHIILDPQRAQGDDKEIQELHKSPDRVTLKRIFHLLGRPNTVIWPHGSRILHSIMTASSCPPLWAEIRDVNTWWQDTFVGQGLGREASSEKLSIADQESNGAKHVRQATIELICASHLKIPFANATLSKAAHALGATEAELSEALDLLTSMLMLNPSRRISVEDALSHRFLIDQSAMMRNPLQFMLNIQIQRAQPAAGDARPAAEPPKLGRIDPPVKKKVSKFG